ncbi:MAG TPA: LLM class flavin-dependent oxidoreductase [Candidatus Binataceae bacterium]|nr:LLM class flavin-dependent oxidoreductase [Candidatus Binataceae bacterium]
MGSQKLSFGFTIPQRGLFFGVATWPEMVALARRAEESGRFDSVWVGDSVMAKPRPEALTLLGALTAATGKVRLGVGCMASFPIRDPVIFAHQWATLDMMSGGRMQLAVCTGIVAGGVSAREGAIFGVKDGQRGNRMAENIAICRRLWSEDNVNFAGRYRSFEGVTISPRPIQNPCPIWIAANPTGAGAEKPLARVAKIADGWMTVQLFPGMFKANWEKVSEALRREGRDPDVFPNIEYHNINVNPDRAAALAESKRFLDEYYGPVFSPDMVEAWTAAGSPQQCAAHLTGLARDGAKSIALRITGWNQKGQLERVISEVIPRVEA